MLFICNRRPVFNTVFSRCPVGVLSGEKAKKTVNGKINVSFMDVRDKAERKTTDQNGLLPQQTTLAQSFRLLLQRAVIRCLFPELQLSPEIFKI